MLLIHRRLGPKSDSEKQLASSTVLSAHLHVCMVSHSYMVAERRRQLDELAAQMIEVRQQSSSAAMNAAVSGLAEAVRTMGQSVSKPRPEDKRVGKPEPYSPGKDFGDWDFTFNGYAGTLDPEDSETITNSDDGDSTTQNSSLQPCCTYSRCSHRM